ncbi:hypothetical protein [Candidatus Viadribacter manganicus]|uniref:Uncharacterized protein n=1 Tax=Candidatus Viadribacter manganicus TaxID=1759059 RepID=A0A1B1AIV2_9PROT|nr:hypothetical protein [Candidatus Viadribacter manganicus]ANP46483.1 hypothetical protein ATE48_11425 [Candidatus Viadribacter manganicus]
MLRQLFAAVALGAVSLLAGCVTQMSAADQTPALQYTPPDRTLVAVIDEHTVVREGRPPTCAGVMRPLYGIPTDAALDLLMMGSKEDKRLTMAQFIGKSLGSARAA